MNRSRLLPVPLFLALSLVLCLLELTIVHSRSFSRSPELISLGITMDLTLGIPALYYFLLARPRRWPLLSLVPVFAISVLAAGAILPAAHRAALAPVKLLLPLLEVVVLGFVVLRVRALVQATRQELQQQPYFAEALEEAARKVFGDVPGLGFLLAETTLMYYGVFGWFGRLPAPRPGWQAFTYHRESGYGVLLLVLVPFALLPEMFIAHLLIGHWSPLAAWIWTSLELYGLLWLLGDYQALRRHPILFDGGLLRLRTGLRWRVDLPFEDIAYLDSPSTEEDSGAGWLKISAGTAPNRVLGLKRTVQVRGLFGIRREARRIGIFLDDAPSFEAALRQRLGLNRKASDTSGRE